MSTAHRPTWAPAQARDVGSGSRQVSVKDVNSYTKLKFRQPGQGTSSDISRRDLKRELEKAEQAARNKRKGITTTEDEEDSANQVKVGLVEGAPAGATQAVEDEQAAKRRKLIEDAAELDRDDSDEEQDDDKDDNEASASAAASSSKGKGKADESTTANGNGAASANDDDDDDDSDEDEDDDEDETAELLRELEKIKRERAEEKAKQERERAASDAVGAEEAAASGNPLLNLQAALSGNKSYNSPGRSSASSFQIKKRWDDDVIFKNQAVKSDEPRNEFVNDLIRTQFHKRFLQKYIA